MSHIEPVTTPIDWGLSHFPPAALLGRRTLSHQEM